MRLSIASNKAIRYACMNFHYAKAVPVNTIGYNVYNDADEWCGVIVYGSGANNRIGEQYNLSQGQILELVRVALNGKQECTSKAVAMSLKNLRRDCPLCRLVVSYADCDQNHLGTIYQATNWLYIGLSLENSKDGSWIIKSKRWHGKSISDFITRRGGLRGLSRECYIKKYMDRNAICYITKGKRKYLMPMDKKMRKIVLPLAKPYPKNDDWVKIDRNMFKEKKLIDTN